MKQFYVYLHCKPDGTPSLVTKLKMSASQKARYV